MPHRTAHESAAFPGQLQLDACYNRRRPDEVFCEEDISMLYTESEVARYRRGFVVFVALLYSSVLAFCLSRSLFAWKDKLRTFAERDDYDDVDNVEMGSI